MNEPKLMKKETITDKTIEKQKKLLIMAVICVVTLLISSSYALLTNFDKTDEVVNFKTGNLNMTVNNTAGAINLNGNLPENDENGLLNATPITLTLTNTGTMKIEGYEVKLVSDSSQTSTLNEDYIKYAISTDGTSYGSPSILTDTDNIIFNGYNLEVDASKTIYLKVWIDESAGNYALNKTYYGSIEVELYQKKEEPASEKIKAVVKSKQTDTCKTYVEEDGITYISGTKKCIDFNYVWYSGKLWRITAIYPDGTMKMITDGLMTALTYGSNNKFYTDENTSSYMYQWLNQEFLPTLYNYENIIVEDASWNASPGNGTISTKLPVEGQEEVLVNASVGLLNSYEYYKSYQNTSYDSGYLNIGYDWWLLNPYSASSSNVWSCWNVGKGGGGSPSLVSYSARPAVNLKSTIQLMDGMGTEDDPYRIKGDREDIEENVTLINTRSSGEYVKLVDEESAPIFRIVGTETINGASSTKLVLNDYVKESDSVLEKKFSSSSVLWSEVDSNDTTYWRGYLNNTWIKEVDPTYNSETGTLGMLEKGTYYLGRVTSGGNYKLAVCKAVDNGKSVQDCIDENTEENPTVKTSVIEYSGLPRYGEMFASQFGTGYGNSSNMWLITSQSSSRVWEVNSTAGGTDSGPSSLDYGARPSINLKSTILIKSGSGTKKDPFVVSLPSSE